MWIHNHEVPSSILGPATRKHSRNAGLFSFIYIKTLPKGADVGMDDAESLLSKRQTWRWPAVSEANEA